MHVPEGPHAQAREPRLGRAEEPDVDERRAQPRDHQDERGGTDQQRHPARVGTTRGHDAAVDRLLDGDGDDDPPEGRDDGQEQRSPDAHEDLWRHLDALAQGREDAQRARRGDPGAGRVLDDDLGLGLGPAAAAASRRGCGGGAHSVTVPSSAWRTISSVSSCSRRSTSSRSPRLAVPSSPSGPSSSSASASARRSASRW
ncbi:hypothetical protein D3C74_327650 [compost metagenome]